jgi:UDP-N-acetylglucosamine--N-acetylmuramyl-(pentapeptide) pyrophosphoryl-undecaprenol N-acetylglucosamine transferase
LVNAVMLGFKECAPFFPKTRTEITGTPVRTELVPLDRADARRKLGLQPDLPTLLVMGGSQGASGINQALIKALPFLQGVSLQVIHLSGARDERLVADNYRRENVPAYIGAFHHRMEEVYSAADLVVARAGAASLAEFAAFSLPGILIPFPYATDDHQTRNAEIYAHAEAAILLKQADLSGELLARNIRELMENPQRLQQMAANCARLTPKDAAGRVANTMEKYTTHEARV